MQFYPAYVWLRERRQITESSPAISHWWKQSTWLRISHSTGCWLLSTWLSINRCTDCWLLGLQTRNDKDNRDDGGSDDDDVVWCRHASNVPRQRVLPRQPNWLWGQVCDIVQCADGTSSQQQTSRLLPGDDAVSIVFWCCVLFQLA